MSQFKKNQILNKKIEKNLKKTMHVFLSRAKVIPKNIM